MVGWDGWYVLWRGRTAQCKAGRGGEWCGVVLCQGRTGLEVKCQGRACLCQEQGGKVGGREDRLC